MDIVVPDYTATALSTLRCLRPLRRQGHRIWSVGEKLVRRPAYYSNLPRATLTHPPGGLVPFLLRWRENFRDNPLLLLTGDAQVVEVSRHRRELSAGYDFLLPDDPVIELLMQKAKFYPWAQAARWPVAATHTAPDPDALLRLGRNLDYPLVVKPFLMHAERVDSFGELQALLPQLAPLHYQSLVVQEWISGGDDQLYFCFMLFDEQSRPVQVFLGRKLRQFPRFSGSTSLAVSLQDNELCERSVALFRSVGYRGFGSLEYKFDPERKQFFIMEPTVGRFNLQIALARAAGVNFPESLVRLLRHEPVTPVQARPGMTWIYESDDFKAYLAGSRQYGFLRNFRKKHVRVLFSWTDPWPFWHEILHRLRNFWQALRKTPARRSEFPRSHRTGAGPHFP